MSTVIAEHCHQVITNAHFMLKQGMKKNDKTGGLNERFSDILAAHMWLPKSYFYYQKSSYEWRDCGTLSSSYHNCTYHASVTWKKIKGHLNERFSDFLAAHMWLPKSNLYYEIGRYELCDCQTLSLNHHYAHIKVK